MWRRCPCLQHTSFGGIDRVQGVEGADGPLGLPPPQIRSLVPSLSTKIPQRRFGLTKPLLDRRVPTKSLEPLLGARARGVLELCAQVHTKLLKHQACSGLLFILEKMGHEQTGDLNPRARQRNWKLRKPLRENPQLTTHLC